MIMVIDYSINITSRSTEILLSGIDDKIIAIINVYIIKVILKSSILE